MLFFVSPRRRQQFFSLNTLLGTAALIGFFSHAGKSDDPQQKPEEDADDIPCWPDCRPHSPIALGQPPLVGHGIERPRQPIKSVLGGIYSRNTTLYFRNSPFRVDRELIVESGATLTIETGVQLYFDTGVGIKVSL
jgi:hypothetical protein